MNTKAGTRGPKKWSLGPVGRWLLARMGDRHRKQDYTFQGMDVLFLTTVGSRSGERRTAPVSWFPAGDPDAWLIVASVGGSIKNPSWYHNIAAHPDDVWIELADRKVRVSAEQLEGSEREQRWGEITTAQPRYAGYQSKTDREIPVLRLTAVS